VVSVVWENDPEQVRVIRLCGLQSAVSQSPNIKCLKLHNLFLHDPLEDYRRLLENWTHLELLRLHWTDFEDDVLKTCIDSAKGLRRLELQGQEVSGSDFVQGREKDFELEHFRVNPEEFAALSKVVKATMKYYSVLLM
jgi:hypothetical protein